MTAPHTAWIVLKTLIFLILFWLVFLYALPIGLSIVEVELGIQRFPPMPVLAGALLLVSTLLAAWAALTLAIAGKGTPLPFDPPRSLVTGGPYAYLRHPFVAAATGQIVALGIALGSIPILAYATTLTALWYFFVRPREERGLDARFGERVREYRRAVRGFRPRLSPYKVRS